MIGLLYVLGLLVAFVVIVVLFEKVTKWLDSHDPSSPTRNPSIIREVTSLFRRW